MLYRVWFECDGRIIARSEMVYVAYGNVVLETGGTRNLYEITGITWTPGGTPNYVLSVKPLSDAPGWAQRCWQPVGAP